MQQSFDLNLQSLYKVVRVTLCQLLQQGKEEGLFTWKMGEEEDRVSSQHNSQMGNSLPHGSLGSQEANYCQRRSIKGNINVCRSFLRDLFAIPQFQKSI